MDEVQHSLLPYLATRAHTITAFLANSYYLVKTHPGAVAFVPDVSAPTGSYHLLHGGDRGVSLSRDNGTPDRLWPAAIPWICRANISSKMASGSLRWPALRNWNVDDLSGTPSCLLLLAPVHRFCAKRPVPRHGTLTPQANPIWSFPVLLCPLRQVYLPRRPGLVLEFIF